MYKRLSNFLNINNLINSLQFGLRPKYSTTHALINLTESIRQTLGEGSFGCGVFVDLQKAFGTVDHKILMHKLEYYGIRGVCNDCSSLTCHIVNNLSVSMGMILI